MSLLLAGILDLAGNVFDIFSCRADLTLAVCDSLVGCLHYILDKVACGYPYLRRPLVCLVDSVIGADAGVLNGSCRLLCGGVDDILRLSLCARDGGGSLLLSSGGEGLGGRLRLSLL